MNAKYFVFVSGGLVQDVTDARLQPADDKVIVIDYDNCQEGNNQCPVCLEEPAPSVRVCPNCGFNLDSNEYADAVAAYKKVAA